MMGLVFTKIGAMAFPKCGVWWWRREGEVSGVPYYKDLILSGPYFYDLT